MRCPKEPRNKSPIVFPRKGVVGVALNLRLAVASALRGGGCTPELYLALAQEAARFCADAADFFSHSLIFDMASGRIPIDNFKCGADTFRVTRETCLLFKAVKTEHPIGIAAFIRAGMGSAMTPQPDEAVFSYIDRLAKAGVNYFRIFHASSSPYLMGSTIQYIREHFPDAHIEFWYVPSHHQNPLLNNPLHIRKIMEEAHSMGVHSFMIGDPSGRIDIDTQAIAYTLSNSRVLMPFGFSSNDMMGASDIAYLNAATSGASVLDLAPTPVSGGSSLPPFYPMLTTLEQHGINIGLKPGYTLADLKPHINTFETAISAHTLTIKGLGSARPYIDAAQASLAGPQMVGIKKDLDVWNAAYALDKQISIADISKEMHVVAALCGGIASVTPFADSMYRYAFERVKQVKKGKSPDDASLPAGMIDMLSGKLGSTPLSVSPWLRKKALCTCVERVLLGLVNEAAISAKNQQAELTIEQKESCVALVDELFKVCSYARLSRRIEVTQNLICQLEEMEGGKEDAAAVYYDENGNVVLTKEAVMQLGLSFSEVEKGLFTVKKQSSPSVRLYDHMEQHFITAHAQNPEIAGSVAACKTQFQELLAAIQIERDEALPYDEQVINNLLFSCQIP